MEVLASEKKSSRKRQLSGGMAINPSMDGLDPLVMAAAQMVDLAKEEIREDDRHQRLRGGLRGPSDRTRTTRGIKPQATTNGADGRSRQAGGRWRGKVGSKATRDIEGDGVAVGGRVRDQMLVAHR